MSWGEGSGRSVCFTISGVTLSCLRVSGGGYGFTIRVWASVVVTGREVCPIKIRAFDSVVRRNVVCMSGATLVCGVTGGCGCIFLDHPHHFNGSLLDDALRSCFRKERRLFGKLTVRALRGR